MKRFKKCMAFVLSIAICSSFVLPGLAIEESAKLKNGRSELSEQVEELLEGNMTKQTIEVSERELVERMLEVGTITREELNADLLSQANESTQTLRQRGYSDSQIQIIKGYEEGEDAFDYIYDGSAQTRAVSAGATLTFDYGLTGAVEGGTGNTKRKVGIAYEMNWSSCPFWTFTDSFGIGWIAADEDSYPLAMKVDSTMAVVDYYTTSGEYANLYRDVEMDKVSNCIVIGNPILGSADGNYGKRISGVTYTSTQSDSYNIDTVQVFVAYGHTIVTIGVGLDVSLGWALNDSTITFAPSVEVNQQLLVKDDHTFWYNSSDVITAK